MPLTPGTRLGPYEILEVSGSGGMGEVYRARDTRLGRTVAIKVLPTGTERDDESRQRLRREAQAVAALAHPNICALHDVGREGDVEFLVMEHLDGETLEARLLRGPLPLRDALQLSIDVGEALEAAHREGIVHRDLKPSNVMWTKSGPKLLDFGIAKRQRPTAAPVVDPDGATEAASSTVAGTLPYMAPEQIEGRAVDARTDIFAFGALLYEMLIGRRAFPVRASAAVSPPPAPSTVRPEVPRALDRLVAVCLEPTPGRRWQSMADVVRQLRWLAGDQENPPGPERRRRFLRSGHAAWAAAVIAAAILGWALRRPVTGPAATKPNPMPVVVLMDSPLTGRVYDPRTEAAGGTNADDITDAIRNLPIVVHKENTNALWHREEQVVLQNPDLIIAHLSCLLDERAGQGQKEIVDHLFDVADSRLRGVFGYVAALNPRTRFLVYSRTKFSDPEVTRLWVKDTETRFPTLRGRLRTFDVPGGLADATFRDPDTARLLRESVEQLLRLPGLPASADPAGSRPRPAA